MLKTLFFLLVSLSLYGIGYPSLYSEMSAPLYETRVQIDSIVSQDSLRAHVLAYEAHSDRVLGKYRRVKSDSPAAQKKAYHDALQGLQKSHSELKRVFLRELKQSIATDDFSLFLALISVKNEDDYLDPYLREKIYTYYSAHRSMERSCYLDTRMKKEWASIAPYYPKNGLTDYAKTDNAYYREVLLLTTNRSPYSTKVRAFLKENNVRFTEYDLESSDEGKALFRKYKGRRIPMVIIDHRVVEGYNEFEMNKLLRR